MSATPVAHTKAQRTCHDLRQYRSRTFHPERKAHAPPDDHGQFSRLPTSEVEARLAVVATLTKGYDLDYIWRQVDRGPAKGAADYYIQASETGGEPPGRWWGPAAKALGLEHGQVVEREPYDLLFGEHKAPDGTQLGRPQRAARRPPTSTPACWPPNHTRQPNASTNSASKPPARPGKGRCTSTSPSPCPNRSRSSTPP
jgi:hypothetical protein